LPSIEHLTAINDSCPAHIVLRRAGDARSSPLAGARRTGGFVPVTGHRVPAPADGRLSNRNAARTISCQ
jgi:hypothetical protein